MVQKIVVLYIKAGLNLKFQNRPKPQNVAVKKKKTYSGSIKLKLNWKKPSTAIRKH